MLTSARFLHFTEILFVGSTLKINSAFQVMFADNSDSGFCFSYYSDQLDSAFRNPVLKRFGVLERAAVV